VSKYINLIGVELEGSWARISRDVAIVPDQSVRIVEGYRHAGELVSPPMDLESIKVWLERHIPQGVNETCGYHIHVSLKKFRDYNRLTSMRFYTLLLKRIRQWGLAADISPRHHFWQRLEGTFTFTTPGGNTRNFCRKEFLPEAQIYEVKKGGDGAARHCHLNFCYSLHGTVELRLFPAWSNYEHYVGSLQVFIDAIEEFLVAEDQRRENKVRIKIGATPRRPLRQLYQEKWA